MVLVYFSYIFIIFTPGIHFCILYLRVIKSSGKKLASASTNDPEKKSYDILPGVGEIVLWAAKDKRGYLIDTNGSWYTHH